MKGQSRRRTIPKTGPGPDAPVLSSTLPRQIADVGGAFRPSGPKAYDEAETEEGDAPELPPDQRAAWDLTHAFQARYFKLRHRMPRRGHVMKYFKRFLAQVRAAA